MALVTTKEIDGELFFLFKKVWHPVSKYISEHADELMSDEEAEEHIEVIEEQPGRERKGKVHAVNLDTICDHFEDGEKFTLDALKAKRLAPQNAGRLKILARGTMNKQLTVEADSFSLQAVKMITLAGGHSEQYK